MIAVTHMIELTTERVQAADFILEVGAWCILVCFGTVQDVGNQTGELMGYVYIEMERNINASSFFHFGTTVHSNLRIPITLTLHVSKNHMHAYRLLQIYIHNHAAEWAFYTFKSKLELYACKLHNNSPFKCKGWVLF